MQGSCRDLSDNQAYHGQSNLIEDNHLLKKIEDNINFDFVDLLTEDCYCPNNGRPSFPPKQYFKMMLVKHLYGIKSNRSLVKEIRYNLAYNWFCGFILTDDIPHHASLSNIKKRFEVDMFEKFFLSIIEQCREMGLINSNSVMTDSTLFQANASLSSMKLKESKDNVVTEDKSVRKKRKLSNKTHLSYSDPDATLAFKKGTVRSLKYKAHICGDSNSRVITAIEVTTGAVHDSQTYIGQLNYLKDKINIDLHEAIADSAYGSGELLTSLKEMNIKTNIPLFSSRSGSAKQSQLQDFKFNKQENHFICPEGKILKACNSKTETIYYVSKTSDCKGCPLKETCQATKKANAKVVTRNIYSELYEQIRADMETDWFKEKMYQRMWKIEGVMNEIKNYHGLNRAHYRGLDNVKIQGYMAAIAINIKRIVFCVYVLRCLIYSHTVAFRLIFF